MFLPTIILAALFGNQVDASASQQKWVTGRNATGLVDPNVSICTYWVNKISNATCKEVESHFDINFNQLHAWVSDNSSQNTQVL
ncbi:hypothetical protein VI817_001818 [Penicillium citrinum]|nr:hypothetical protein VI817_001818 [Penicillium citrinum]